MLIAGLILGMIIGAAIGYLYAGRRLGAATERARAAEDRAALVDGQLAERFQSLSAQALDASTARFLEIAEGRLRAENVKAAGELENRRAAVEHLVEPLRSRSPGWRPSCTSRTRPGASRTPPWPSRSTSAATPPSSCGPRRRRW